MSKKPTITSRETVAKTRLFQVEEVGLRFANGVEVRYERLCSPPQGAVLVIPVLNQQIFLIREYMAGVDRYELCFPKGIIEQGESAITAADREIKEEIGYGAGSLKLLRVLSVAPGYSDFRTHIVLATGLYAHSLSGDEPEELEVVPWPLASVGDLLDQEDFVEARSIAALYLLQHEMECR